MSEAPAAKPRPSLFAGRDFVRLWLIGCVAFVVRWLEMLAVGLYAYQVTGSAFLVAMLSLLRILPMGLFGAVLGALADRVERHSALVAVVAVSMAVTASLALLASFDVLLIWHLALASFIHGICWAADNPVRRMMIGDVVGAERMSTAMSVDAGTGNASRVLGPTLGGFLLAQWGIEAVFWLGVALYLPSLVAAVQVAVRSRPRARPAGSILGSIGQGLAWLRGDRRMIGVFLITIYFNVFGWPFTSMIPVIATDHLGLDPKGAGLLASCEGIGGLIGALIIAALARPDWHGRIYVASVAAYFALLMVFAVAPGALLAGIALLTTGMLSAVFAVMQSTLVYRCTPTEMRARLLGVLSVCIGTAPLGFLYLGFLAELMGPQWATVVLGAQGLLAMLVSFRWWNSALRT
jgi:MFS family permease